MGPRSRRADISGPLANRTILERLCVASTAGEGCDSKRGADRTQLTTPNVAAPWRGGCPRSSLDVPGCVRGVSAAQASTCYNRPLRQNLAARAKKRQPNTYELRRHVTNNQPCVSSRTTSQRGVPWPHNREHGDSAPAAILADTGGAARRARSRRCRSA